MSDSRPARRGKRLMRVTQADVAADVGVSQALVSIAYRGAEGVSSETRERIFASGRRLGYVPDANAARLASRTPRTVGLFLRDLRLAVTAEIHEGVSEVAENNGVDLIISIGHADGAQDRRELENLVRAGADVVIAAGTLLPDADLVQLLGPQRLVCVTRRVDGIDSVRTDDVEGARLIVQHLTELGHKRIAHLAWPLDRDVDTRARAYSDAMRAHGLEPVLVDAGYTSEGAQTAAASLLDQPAGRRPTAIFAASDLAAFGTLDALMACGLSAPRDLSVVGYDNTPPSRFRAISLTTVDQGARGLGRRAADLAIRRLSHPDQPAVDDVSSPQLFVRSSSGPVPR